MSTSFLPAPYVFMHYFTTSPSSRYRQLKQQFELKVEEEQILQAKLQQSSFHQQQEELERLRKAIGQIVKKLTRTFTHPVSKWTPISVSTHTDVIVLIYWLCIGSTRGQ